MKQSSLYKALHIAFVHGGTDEAHHKAWVIDQMVRALTGKGYDAWVEERKAGGYDWDVGIAP